MRRRASTETVEPPGRLVTYVEADWLPLVHPSRYLPERHYSHRGQLEGDPGQPSQLWREGEAFRLWTRARHNWVEEHGWPGGWDLIDLMRQEIRLRREVGARAACRVRR